MYGPNASVAKIDVKGGERPFDACRMDDRSEPTIGGSDTQDSLTVRGPDLW
jgi:hypothetical protein